MTLYLVFHRNAMTGEDFTTPVEAESPMQAQASLTARYPHPTYQYLTCFAKTELQSILNDAERWPGVASKPQPTLEQMMARVTSGMGKLPPLPNRKPTAQPAAQMTQATGASVKVVQGAAHAWGVGAVPLAKVEPATPKKTAAKPTAKPASSFMPTANAGRSVIDVLRALRG